ncbi:MAG: homocitrate synthase [Pseudomonadota bacterium]
MAVNAGKAGAEKKNRALALHATAQEKVVYLQNIQPYLIDLSLRENPVGARVGQTLADKLAILPLVRQFGFSNVLLGTLDYSIPDELEVDDDFLMYMQKNNIDMTGGFVFTAMGQVDGSGNFTPDPSMLKMQSYGVPNTLHEIYLSDIGMQASGYTIDTVLASIGPSVQWLMENIRGDNGGPPRILINIVDGCDAFAQDPERTCDVLQLLSTLPIQGISIEDDRGTYLPFQVGIYVAMARAMLPSPFQILVHMHAGGGFENASLIEALSNGADGVWGGLPKRAAVIGHASLGELIANLVRLGNVNMASTYQLQQLLPLATRLQILDEEQRVPDDLPILGNNAYRLTLGFFEQLDGRFMDLPPTAIGGKYGYRVCPVVSDAPVLAGRLAEVTGQPASSFPANVLEMMIRLMRRDQRAGLRIIYDEPANLLDLYQRAQAAT